MAAADVLHAEKRFNVNRVVGWFVQHGAVQAGDRWSLYKVLLRRWRAKPIS